MAFFITRRGLPGTRHWPAGPPPLTRSVEVSRAFATYAEAATAAAAEQVAVERQGRAASAHALTRARDDANWHVFPLDTAYQIVEAATQTEAQQQARQLTGRRVST